ncbi:NAD(P)-dependent alcohol dehydrogenase [Actinomadura sp. DC4]|uniref:zinc-dependent alcohol dehydrogenase family protein n=1 Tax=Actinomadura sp. DC4 TaxID=3055069 RepID=UPI0025B128FA|nr:NAD(P)-dependent alcohol dehydrogenase [Actinomadura sp. DC4]MDN3355474.1 NAD(P)-dependent alcohol dehydrogenase [Actinomadura sp. DC4]
MLTYRLDEPGGVDGIVAYETGRPDPKATEIVVRVRAASINRRDLLILHQRYPLPAVPGVIPLSDGAGEVVEVGDQVTRFKVGDRVVGGYWPRWHDGRLRPELVTQLGCTQDGMLTEYALLDEQWAVGVPEHLTWAEAASLPCAALTAWTSLVGGRPLLAGQTVLTLGTGDVALAALQFAKAMGCRVVSTTSSEAKAARLRSLGADHVVNYVSTPEWWRAVRELTGGLGADMVVETTGPATIEQSVRAASTYGQIVLLWGTGDPAGTPGSAIEIPGTAFRSSLVTLRRVFVGHRADHEAMNRAISTNLLRPVVDRAFDLADAREAYTYYAEENPFGKVVITSGA